MNRTQSTGALLSQVSPCTLKITASEFRKFMNSQAHRKPIIRIVRKKTVPDSEGTSSITIPLSSEVGTPVEESQGVDFPIDNFQAQEIPLEELERPESAMLKLRPRPQPLGAFSGHDSKDSDSLDGRLKSKYYVSPYKKVPARYLHGSQSVDPANGGDLSETSTEQQELSEEYGSNDTINEILEGEGTLLVDNKGIRYKTMPNRLMALPPLTDLKTIKRPLIHVRVTVKKKQGKFKPATEEVEDEDSRQNEPKYRSVTIYLHFTICYH